MPGLAVILSEQAESRQRADELVAGLTVDPLHHVEPVKGFCCRGSLHHLGHFHRQLVASHDDIGVVLDGWIFTSGGVAEEAARYVLERYIEKGIDAVTTLNGQFNLLIWDPRSRDVFFVNDRHASRPMFYHEAADALYLAPEAKAILEAAPIRKKLNEMTLVNQLSYSRIWIGQDTFFEGIQAVPQATVLHWHDGRCRLRNYWQYHYEPVGEIDDAFVDRAADVYRDALARQRTVTGRKGLFLTGGLDSRSTLAAFPRERRAEVTAFTYAVDPAFDEVAIARRVAEHLGAPWSCLRFTPADCIEHARAGVRLTEGLDIFAQGFSLAAFDEARSRIDVAYNGFLIDVVLGGTYLDQALVDHPDDHEAGRQYALRKFRYFSESETDRLFKFREAPDLLRALSNRLGTQYLESSNTRAADRIDEIVASQRFGRNLYLRLRWFAQYFENIASVLDNDFVDLFLAIPARERIRYGFYRRFMRRLDEGCMRIPYNNTTLPPSWPYALWKMGSRREGRREKLYRAIYRVSGGRCYPRYTHYYSNFDEWLRTDPDWIKMCDDLLLSKDSLCCERYLDRVEVNRLITEHRSARASHYTKLIQLMTLELFLREFFATT